MFVSVLSRATGAADAVTVCCQGLKERFGGTVIPQPVDTSLFDPGRFDRDRARRDFGFDGPTVVFPGVPRTSQGAGAAGGGRCTDPRRAPGGHLPGGGLRRVSLGLDCP